MSKTATPQTDGTLAAPAESQPAAARAAHLLKLDRPECLRLRAGPGVGRAAVRVGPTALRIG